MNATKTKSSLLPIACAAATVTAFVALLGALLDLRLLASGVSSSVPMAPTTALAIVLLSAALHPRLPWSRSAPARLGLLLPVFALAIPPLAVFSLRYLDMGWKGIVAAHPFEADIHIWMMSPLTAGLFIVMGTSAAAAATREDGLASRSAACGATFSAALAAVILIGYLYGVPLFYGGRVFPMAATTAVCFLALSAAFIADAGRRFWPWNLFEGGAPRAVMLRSFLPFTVGIVLLMGFVDTRMDLSHSVVFSAALLLGALLLTAWLVTGISAFVAASIEATERRLSSSEILNRRLVERLPQRLFVKDRDSVYLFCNPSFALDLKIEPEQIAGKDDFAFFPRELAERYQADDRKVMAEGEIKDVVERYELAGAERWIHTVKVPYRDNHGAIIGVLGLFEDVTDRKQAEGALLESEARYRRIIDTTTEAFCEIDSTGRVASVNPRANQLFGYRPGEMIGLSLLDDLYFPEDKELAVERLQRRRKGESATFEQRFRAKSGEALWLMVSATPNIHADGTYRGSFAMMTDIAERKRSEADLERLKTAIDQAGESIFITDEKGTIVFVNQAFATSTGYTSREAVGKNPRILKSGRQDQAFYHDLWRTISSGRVWKGRLINKRKDGSFLTEDSTISPMLNADGRITNYVAVKRDVAEQVRLEGELRQSQKMESVGLLAGGVAHDFNNILTAINGYTKFAMAGLPENEQRWADLNEVLAAAARAARLTRQLLAFSRKQILDPQILDINAVVGEMVNMLKRVIGEDITLRINLSPHPCVAKVDASQIEQVFLNLAVNARDAMANGGTLTFETGILTPAAPRPPLVYLSCRDTGCGMTDEVKAHLFEPFFTTKEKGKGTGLGLSTVYGVIKQSGGEIEVESAPGSGTTFRIYFPQISLLASNQGKDAANGERIHDAPGGSETVLFVEDEEALRRLGARTLSASGYTVLTAGDGQEALKVLERHGRAVDLLVTDVVMPGMSGRELAQAVASKNLAPRTLFLSGFADNAIVQGGVLEPGLAFMYKPFTPAALLRKLREVLDGRADKARA